MPINIAIKQSSVHDATILEEQLDKLVTDHPIIANNKNVIVGDTAYDSKPIRRKIKKYKLGILQTLLNIRNTRDEVKLNRIHTINNSLITRLYQRNRFKIEHYFGHLKQLRSINIRDDRYIKMFECTLMIGILIIIFRTVHTIRY